jgi:pyruvate dehydrogenase E1 component beta subunit
MVGQALAAAGRLAAERIQVEVIDARWLSPFGLATVMASVPKTGRLVVAHEANLTGAFSAQVVASIAEAGERLRCAPVRTGAPDVRIPAARSLLSAVIPDADLIAARIRQVARSEAG